MENNEVTIVGEVLHPVFNNSASKESGKDWRNDRFKVKAVSTIKDGKTIANYIPCIWWYPETPVKPGDMITIKGSLTTRLQSFDTNEQGDDGKPKQKVVTDVSVNVDTLEVTGTAPAKEEKKDDDLLASIA